MWSRVLNSRIVFSDRRALNNGLKVNINWCHTGPSQRSVITFSDSTLTAIGWCTLSQLNYFGSGKSYPLSS